LLRGFERRLRRLAALVERWALDTAHERDAANARDIVVGMIRAGLVSAGLDPEEAVALRRAAQSDNTPLPAPGCTDAHPPSAHDILAERLSKLAQRYREKGERPVLANASLAQLMAAYCFGGVAVEATG
jgi:20S proteasome alpha/beta subunit